MSLKIIEKINALENIAQEIDELDFSEGLENLAMLKKRIDSPRFEIAVIGEFSTGKSSFINALLQHDLLPATYRPTTNQIMKIQHDASRSEVCIDRQGSGHSPIPLTKENIKQLANDTHDSLVIKTAIPAPMDQFIIYDTPGVNDPASLSEEIIFDLLGKVDVIIFLLRADSALKETEIDFIKQLVPKKDLGKFFFIINFADTLEPADAIDVQKHVINVLGKFLQWPVKALSERVFLYSAKQTLAHAKSEAALADESAANFLHTHHQLLHDIHGFSTASFEELVSEFSDNALTEVAQMITNTLSVAIDQAEEKDLGYQQALSEVNAEINDFRTRIQSEEFAFRDSIRKKKREMLSKVEEEFNSIRENVKSIILSANNPDIGNADWTQKHIRKLVDDKIPPLLENFAQEIKIISADFDLQITPSLNRSIDNIEGIKKSYDFSPIIAGTGVASAGYALVSAALPLIAGVGGIAAIGAFFLPGLGSTLISGVGSLVSGGSSLTGFAYTGVRDKIHSWVDENDKQRYLAELDKIIFEMQMLMIKELDSKVVPEQISAAFIENKFPLKQDITVRQKQEILVDRQWLTANIKEMIWMRQEVFKVMHGELAGEKS
ncbi:dynamin family protein [Methyloprofundus sp.]|uniref:dynamin family protein n=1 Tax=Methyloprofundus sp. TaxID=2020875 RepID=UPI003D0BA2B3